METENNQHVWIDLDDKIRNMTRHEIEALMVAEAKLSKLVPSDLNEFGRPEIYLRSKYEHDDDEKVPPKWISDGYVMFVSKKE
jgi:hypothetical protein